MTGGGNIASSVPGSRFPDGLFAGLSIPPGGLKAPMNAPFFSA